MIVYVLIEEFNAPSDGHGGRPVNVLGVYETEDLAKANCHKEIVRARTRGLLLPEDEEELADAGPSLTPM
jgi:hypothetical protein